MDAGSLVHTTYSAGMRLNTSKFAALKIMPMPKDLKQLRPLLRVLFYNKKILAEMAKRIRPINSLLTEGVKYRVMPAMGVIVRNRLEERSAPTIWVYPAWDAVAENRRRFLMHCDATMDAFGATLEQGQQDGSIWPIGFISRATLQFECHWTPIDLEAGSIVWSTKRLRGYLWGTCFRSFLGPQDARKPRQGCGTQPPSPAMARIFYGVPLYSGIPQRQRQR